MRIAVVGSSDFPDLDLVRLVIARFDVRHVLVSGDARGVDFAAQREALRLGMTVVVVRPGDPSIRHHYLARNDVIVECCDRLVAFWDGRSRGTKYVIDRMRNRGPNPEVYAPRPDGRGKPRNVNTCDLCGRILDALTCEGCARDRAAARPS